jgi:hypothetical protein
LHGATATLGLACANGREGNGLEQPAAIRPSGTACRPHQKQLPSIDTTVVPKAFPPDLSSFVSKPFRWPGKAFAKIGVACDIDCCHKQAKIAAHVLLQ